MCDLPLGIFTVRVFGDVFLRTPFGIEFFPRERAVCLEVIRFGV